ncbi:Alpha-ribazole-5'-phosphate phosphatase [Rhodovulum sp. P5]|uniref:alpha-ribazole phosphatase family protein n=1 Tax=Rhodovulum sp. P5 TaxID=1564506 RepID=UPI0009C3125D|nr:alpha-ribazole phosphatase family protein [Rhodovulum sp. P5]ARE40491.1 Alpha-ribazole-5'-phosphate phosphatase [Rhodovulum sp. P5]
MCLTLVRHTAPDVAPGTCYGRLDLPPGPDFPDEADRLTRSLPPATRILSSPLTRCLRLADHIAQARGLRVETDPRLAEMDFGTWEGVAWDDVPLAELDAWAADFDHARPHGGESVAMFKTRVADLLTGLREGQGCLLITHAGVMRAALNLTGQDATWQRRFAFGEALTLSAEDLGRL